MSISRGKVTIHVENNITKLRKFIEWTPDQKYVDISKIHSEFQVSSI